MRGWPWMRRYRWWGLLVAGLLITSGVQADAASTSAATLQPTIAIIIDDMGNQREWGERTVRLPFPMTLAFLPQRPYTQQHATLAHRLGKEIMLHAPMENQRNLPLGELALTSTMDAHGLAQTLRTAIASIPHLSGVNNHMGSRLTEDVLAMEAVMGELRQHPLYFVDSRTTAASVAYDSARRHGIPALNRDVFLDHVISESAIHVQFLRLLDIARRQGTAIAIGHPHPETVRYLEHALPRLAEQGISVATVRGIWAMRHQAAPMFEGPTRLRPSGAILAQATPVPIHGAAVPSRASESHNTEHRMAD